MCVVTACQSPNKIPDDIIGIDKMKFILWDMIHAGKLSQIQYENSIYKRRKDTTRIHKDSLRFRKDTLKTNKDSFNLRLKTTDYFQQVFEIYHITKDEFYKSYRYYEEHPDKNKILMDSVSAYAARQRQDLYKRIQ